MNFTISGHHVEVNSATREYVITKLNHVLHHFDDIVEVIVGLSVKNLVYRCEVTVHVQHGKSIHVAAEADDMQAAIDTLSDKLAPQMAKHKEHKEQSFERPTVMPH